jgi:hypothetical protein
MQCVGDRTASSIDAPLLSQPGPNSNQKASHNVVPTLHQSSVQLKLERLVEFNVHAKHTHTSGASLIDQASTISSALLTLRYGDGDSTLLDSLGADRYSSDMLSVSVDTRP